MTIHLATGDAAATWCQLTYTSADVATGGRGGWGVKEVGGGPDRTRLDLMRSGVITTLNGSVALPDFPSTSQLEARDRRLLCRVVEDELVLWHAVAAGPDATGRPGNVFNHVALVAGGPSVVRPIDYWRSPDWCAPFGALEVNCAYLPTRLHVGSAVGVEQVVDYVQAATSRRLSLEWVLAACAHVLDTHATLVLGVAHPDEAALWIGALSHLTGPVQARRMSWLTFERGPAVATACAEGLTVLCVPRADLEDARTYAPANALVLDTAAMPDEDGDSWVLGPLRFPRAPEWQNAMLDVFARSRRDAVTVLRRADDFVDGVSASEAEDLPLGWSLWMSLLDAGPVVAQRSARASYCLRWAPPSQHDSAAIQALVREVADDSQVLAELEDAPSDVRALVDRYRATVYVAGGWSDGAPPDLLGAPSADLVAEVNLGPILAAGVAELRGPEVARVSAAAKLIGFVTIRLGAGLDPIGGVEAPSGVQALAEARERLLDPSLALTEQERQTLLVGLRPALTGTSPAPAYTGSGSADAKVEPWTHGGQVLEAGSPPAPPAVDDPADPARSEVAPPGNPPDLASDPWPVEQPRPVCVSGPTSQPGPRAMAAVDAVDRLHDYLAAQVQDPVRARAVADAVLVAAGVDDVPLRGVKPSREQADVVEAIMTGDYVHPLLERQALRWLLCYWTLAELGLLGEGRPVPAPEPVRRRAGDPENLELVHVELHALGRAIPEVATGYLRVERGNGRYPFEISLLTTRLTNQHLVGALSSYPPYYQEQ